MVVAATAEIPLSSVVHLPLPLLRMVNSVELVVQRRLLVSLHAREEFLAAHLAKNQLVLANLLLVAALLVALAPAEVEHLSHEIFATTPCTPRSSCS